MKKKITEFIKVFTVIIIVNILFTLFLLSWVTEDDIQGFPSKYSNLNDKIISLFYYGISTFTTTGYGDIYAKSLRMKLLMSFYMIMVVSASASFLFNF